MNKFEEGVNIPDDYDQFVIEEVNSNDASFDEYKNKEQNEIFKLEDIRFMLMAEKVQLIMYAWTDNQPLEGKESLKHFYDKLNPLRSFLKILLIT